MVAVLSIALTQVSPYDVAAGGEVEQFALAIPGQGSESHPSPESASDVAASTVQVTDVVVATSTVAPRRAGDSAISPGLDHNRDLDHDIDHDDDAAGAAALGRDRG